MPRTRLDRFSETPESYREQFNRILHVAMWRQGIQTKKELAIDLGISPEVLTRYFKTGMHDFEIKQLNKVLKFTEKEREQLWGC